MIMGTIIITIIAMAIPMHMGTITVITTITPMITITMWTGTITTMAKGQPMPTPQA